jgi:altronate dehydratase small subunit
MKSALVISDSDNVATALEILEPGTRLDLPGGRIDVLERIPVGHKVAVRAIAAGSAVVKYGSPIGTATSAIEPGRHVHTHNLESTRGRGDRDAAGNSHGRLAEPE